MNIEKEYELRVFDKDVNMFTLSSNQLIKIDNNSYEIIEYDAGE